MTEASSLNSSSMAAENKEGNYNRPPNHLQDVEPVSAQTEANILPETAENPAEADLEKAVSEKKPAVGMIDPSSFPDGGFEAWMVVAGAFCCLFVSFGWINCIGVFQDYYQTHQLSSYSPSTVSWIPSLETFMMFAGGPIYGKVFDNYGPRYTLLIGSFLHVFGLMMTSISTEYYQFILAQGICSPIGASAIFYPALSSTSTWFFRRRAFAFGVVASGSSLGGVIFPIMIQRLIPEIGFPWAMRTAAFIILALLIFGNLTVKSRIPPSPKPLRIMDFITPLTELPFALLVASAFIFFLGFFIPFNYIILSAAQYGMSPNLASYLISILNAASIFGRTFPGWLGDRYGRYNVLIITSYFSGIIILALWLPARSNAPYIVFSALYGFSSGAFISMIPACVAQISDIRQIGTRTGTMFAILSIGALIGNPIGGAMVAAEGGAFTHAKIFSGVLILAGATGFVATRTSIVGRQIKKKV